MATIKGSDELQKKLKKLTKQIKGKKKPMFKRIGIKLMQEIDNTFKHESHEGQKWPLLTLDTVLARRGEGPVEILKDTGLLRSSFIKKNHTDSRYKVTDEMIRVGTSTEYAHAHEFGTDIIPERRMLPSENRALEISVKVADDYIDEKIKQAGL